MKRSYAEFPQATSALPVQSTTPTHTKPIINEDNKNANLSTSTAQTATEKEVSTIGTLLQIPAVDGFLNDMGTDSTEDATEDEVSALNAGPDASGSMSTFNSAVAQPQITSTVPSI